MLTRVDGNLIHFDLLGPAGARTVVMVHGLSLEGGMWFPQVPVLLEHGYRVLRIDLRGHGGTPSVPGEYTLDDLAADVAGVIRQVVGGPVDYIGLSIGGMIGQNLAFDHPELLRSALWCDTRAGYDHDPAGDWAEDLRVVSEAGSVAPLLVPYLEGSVSPAFIEANPAVAELMLQMMLGAQAEGYLGCAAAIKDFDNRPRLGEVKTPLLLICGTDDTGTPPEANQQIADLVPGARLELIEGGRHTPNIEMPDEFNRLMIDWLDSHAGPAGG